MEHLEREELRIRGHRDALEERILGCRPEDQVKQRAWEDFAASGKIQDYLAYRGMDAADRFPNA